MEEAKQLASFRLSGRRKRGSPRFRAGDPFSFRTRRSATGRGRHSSLRGCQALHPRLILWPRGLNPAILALERNYNAQVRSEEHTSELQSLMRISYAVFCLKKKNHKQDTK